MNQRVYFNSTECTSKYDYILVKADTLEKEEVSSGGIVIAVERSSIERPTSGTVISVGEDVTDIDVGSVVVWPMTDGLDIEFNDGTFILLRAESIVCVKK